MLLQIAAGVRLLVSIGVGFTTTTTLYVLGFAQPFADNVYMYVTLTGAVVVFIRVSLGSPLPELAKLLIPTTTARVHAKVVPAVAEVGV